jgi:hypothetical protein
MDSIANLTLVTVSAVNSIPGTKLEASRPEVGYFESGVLLLTNAGTVGTDVSSNNGGIPIVVTGDAQYHIDFELVNHTINVIEKGSSLSGDWDLYLELVVVDSGGGTLDKSVYYYTEDKTSWDDSGTTNHPNIQPKSIGPGINELYLSQFSSN